MSDVKSIDSGISVPGHRLAVPILESFPTRGAEISLSLSPSLSPSLSLSFPLSLFPSLPLSFSLSLFLHLAQQKVINYASRESGGSLFPQAQRWASFRQQCGPVYSASLVQRNQRSLVLPSAILFSRARRIDLALGIVSPFVRPRREILPGRTFRRLVTPPPLITPRPQRSSLAVALPGFFETRTLHRASIDARRDLNDTTISVGLFMVARYGNAIAQSWFWRRARPYSIAFKNFLKPTVLWIFYFSASQHQDGSTESCTIHNT